MINGILIPVGGAEDKGTDLEAGIIERNRLNFMELGILKNIVNFLESKDARIEVITTASSIPDEVAKNYFDENQSFSHGDFSIDNMLNKNGKLYLIDPIYIDGLYSSWLLDAGKLAHSLNRYNRTDDYLIFYSFFDDKKSIIKLAELTQWIRIYKYSPEELKQRTVLEIRKLLTEI